MVSNGAFSAMSTISSTIFSSSKNGRPPLVDPILPYLGPRPSLASALASRNLPTYYSPKYALQLGQQVQIAALEGMLPQEMSKFLEMALVPQGPATTVRLGDLAVKVGWGCPIEETVTGGMRYESDVEPYNPMGEHVLVSHVLFFPGAEYPREKDFNLNDVEKVPLLQTKPHEYHDKPKKKANGLPYMEPLVHLSVDIVCLSEI
jgi:hypothetical protein